MFICKYWYFSPQLTYLHYTNFLGGQVNGPTVEIENGYLKGFLDPTVGGKPYYSFKGIYFADPPVGPRRFMVR